jgi:hypothetical protein
MNANLTTLKKVLVAAASLDNDQQSFTAEDIIVRAWMDFPESFGLRGYQDRHPDSNRVLAKLMGALGLCGRGWLEQTDTKTYRMTPAGRKMVKSFGLPIPGPRVVEQSVPGLTASAMPASMPRVERPVTPIQRELRAVPSPKVVSVAGVRNGNNGLSSTAANYQANGHHTQSASKVVESVPFEHASSLVRIATSVASQKFSRGGMISFDDACSFWGISRNAKGRELSERLREFDELMTAAAKHVQKTGAPVRTDSRVDVTLTTIVGLQGLHRMLLQRYQRELDLVA